MALHSIVGFTVGFVAICILGLSKWIPAKSVLHTGTIMWRKYLPSLSVLVFALMLIVNMVSKPYLPSLEPFRFKGMFSVTELLTLLLLGAFFTTRFGQGLAAMSVGLILWRLDVKHSQPLVTNLGINLLLVSSVTVLMLGDYMPWLSIPSRRNRVGNVVRAVTLAILCVVSLTLTLFALSDLQHFLGWFSHIIRIDLTKILASTLLYCLLVGWTLVALGTCRHLMLFVLALPTAFLFGFMFGLSGAYLSGFLALILTLGIASGERRMERRVTEANGGVTMVLCGNAL